MTAIKRRDFLKMSASFAALLGLSTTSIPRIAEALSELLSKTPPLLWLQGLSCSGCSVSFLNSEEPGPAEILTDYISLQFNSTVSAATGHIAVEVINETIERGDFLLVVEGGIPAGMPKACKVGGETFEHQVTRAALAAKAVVAVGTCASFGGIPAAENNPTGAVSVSRFLTAAGIEKPFISLPGCPTHPDWIIGTLVHVLKFGLPALDEQARPLIFYHTRMHQQCPRFCDYERERFAKTFGEDGCYFRLGCWGPTTNADCSTRLWNSGTNFCINAGSPCIGCASDCYATKAGLPFFTKKRASHGEEK